MDTSNTKTTFSISSLHLPTPQAIKNAVTLISIVVPVFVLWMQSDDNLFSEQTTHTLSSLGSLLVALVNAVRPFFGISGLPTMVPTSEVTAIKEGKG